MVPAHRALLGFFLGRFAHPDRRQRAVLKNGQVREEVEVLEAHANFGPDRINVLQVRGQVNTVHHNLASLMLFQSVDAADQRRFTRPRRPCNDDPFTAIHRQVDVAQHVECTIPLVHVLNADRDLVRDVQCVG